MAVVYLTNEDKIILEEQNKDSVVSDPNCHADYFNITDDGELSIKTEYAQSLPADLVIPEVVNEIAVDRLSSGMFYNNKQIESVRFPDTISVIPNQCFNQATNLRHLYNTGNIKAIGEKAFRFTRIEKAIFPNLEEFTGTLTFSNVPHLAYADVGKVTVIPAQTFKHCTYLSKVVGRNVKTVGSEAFANTMRLVNLDFVDQLESIGSYGFWISNFDKWDGLSVNEDNLGVNATILQANANMIGKDAEYSVCESPTPTALCQRNPEWLNRVYGVTASGEPVTYKDGCLVFCAIHAFCGFYNLTLNSVAEFENIINLIPNNRLSVQNKSVEKFLLLLEDLNWDFTRYASFTSECVADIHETLQNKGYAIAVVKTSNDANAHAVLVYGVNDKGEALILDSERRYPYDDTKAIRYKLPLHKLLHQTADVITVRKPDFVKIDSITTNADDETKLDFTYSWNCPEFFEFACAGIIAVNKNNYNEETFYVGTSDSNVYDRHPSSGNINPSDNWRWTKTDVAVGDTWVAKAYIQYTIPGVYEDDGVTPKQFIAYSDLVEATRE